MPTVLCGALKPPGNDEHTQRNNHSPTKISCLLENKGEFYANSELIDAMLKVDYFPDRFIEFCYRYECCYELCNLIEKAGQQRNHTSSVNIHHQNSHVPAGPLHDRDSSAVTAPDLLSLTNNIESNVNQNNLQCDSVSTSPLAAGSNDIDSCQLESIVENCGQNIDIEDVSSEDVHSTNRAEQTEDNPFESSLSSSFVLSDSDIRAIIVPNNEIESLKANLCSPLDEREKTTLQFHLKINSFPGDENCLSENTTEPVRDSIVKVENRTLAHAASDTATCRSILIPISSTGVSGVLSPNVKITSGIKCEEDLQRLKLIRKSDDIAVENINENSKGKILLNGCLLSSTSESPGLNSETEVKQYMTEPSVEENGEVENISFITFTYSTFDQYHSVHEDLKEEAEVSLDSTLLDNSNTSTDKEVDASVESTVPENIAFQHQSPTLVNEDIKEDLISVSTSSDNSNTSPDNEVDASAEINIPESIANP
ncbi:hypothetical protein Btru_058298 [Bulinus truncatus]|nr:hypothetical protein Btru_058298 [Bulinus truncatus]